MAEEVKSSRKSKMKKRPPDWEALKVEIAKEIGLWPKVEEGAGPGFRLWNPAGWGEYFLKEKKNGISLIKK